MFMKKLQKNMYVSLLVLAFSSSFAVPIFAQEETSELLLQGATEKDTATLNNMENFLNNVLAGEDELFHPKMGRNAEEMFDEETIQANIEVAKVIEKRMEAEKEEIEKRHLQREQESQENRFSTDIVSFEKNNIKKIHHPLIITSDFEEMFSNTKNFENSLNQEDFFWYVPCSTKFFKNSVAFIDESGVEASEFEYREDPTFVLPSNEEIADTINKQVEEDIVRLKYALIPFIHLYIADVITADGKEYIIPISVDGEEIGLQKGNVYTIKEFLNCMKSYEKPAPLVSETGEIADGTGNNIIPFK